MDIIAGNADSVDDGTDLQPMAKGNYLAEALQNLTTHVEKLNGIVTSFLVIQTKYNRALMTHWHNSPFFGTPTIPSTELIPTGIEALISSLTKAMRGLAGHKANLAMYKQTYLAQSGKKYICSRYNNVN